MYKLGVLILAAVLFSVPTMACLLPATELTAAERDCCKQMADQCGGPGMPSSHSCCQRLASPDTSSFLVPHSQHDVGVLIAIVSGIVPFSAHTPADLTARFRWLEGVHDPPESPPVTTPVLRI